MTLRTSEISSFKVLWLLPFSTNCRSNLHSAAALQVKLRDVVYVWGGWVAMSLS